MTIPADLDTLYFDRRCLAAAHTSHLDALLAALHREGHTEVVLDDLRSRAGIVREMWLIDHPTKRSCYLCEGPVQMGRLCPCFNDLLARRYVNVDDIYAVLNVPRDTVVETFQCHSCGCLSEVTADTALAVHGKHRKYVPFKACKPCNRKAAPKHGHGHKQQHAKAQKPSVMDDLVETASQATTSGAA